MHLLGQIWPFWGPNPSFLEREQKCWYSHIRKPVRHLVPIGFWSGMAPKSTRKINIWPKSTKTLIFDFAASDPLCDFSFQRYSRFRKEKRPKREKVFPHPTAQCVVCKVYFSAQPNNLKLILNCQKYYPI